MADGNGNMINSKLCKRCKNPAPNGISCVKCGTFSHKSCLKELQRKHKYIKFTDDENVICCLDEETADKAQPVITAETVSVHDFSKMSDADIKICHFEEILKQKDFAIKQMELVISNQTIAIEALKEQINLMKMLKPTEESSDLPMVSRRAKKMTQKPHDGASTSKVDNSKHKLPDIKAGTSEETVFTASQVSAAINNATANQACEAVIALGTSVTKSGPVQSIGHRGTRSRTILVGNMANTVSCPIKATVVVPMKHFHVTNLDTATNESSLMSYLRQFVADVEVTKLSARNPHRYSSFKVSVPASAAEGLLNSDIWPQGVVLNHFFLSRRQ